jgi:hypothetical protein
VTDSGKGCQSRRGFEPVSMAVRRVSRLGASSTSDDAQPAGATVRELRRKGGATALKESLIPIGNGSFLDER